MTDISTILMAQLMDPFRIGLLVALLATTIRNAAITGWLLPLAAGLVFVAVIIVVAFPAANQDLWLTIGVGVVANAVITAVLGAAWLTYRHLRS
jgi:hypothetical protein